MGIVVFSNASAGGRSVGIPWGRREKAIIFVILSSLSSLWLEIRWRARPARSAPRVC